jgi:hypothetical protein
VYYDFYTGVNSNSPLASNTNAYDFSYCARACGWNCMAEVDVWGSSARW